MGVLKSNPAHFLYPSTTGKNPPELLIHYRSGAEIGGGMAARRYAPPSFIRQLHRFAVHLAFSNRTRRIFSIPLPQPIKNPPEAGFFYWLGERDSNPRWRCQRPQSYH